MGTVRTVPSGHDRQKESGGPCTEPPLPLSRFEKAGGWSGFLPVFQNFLRTVAAHSRGRPGWPFA